MVDKKNILSYISILRYFLIACIFSIGWYTLVNDFVSIDSSKGYYLFSTTSQILLGLFAIVSTFVVFRINQLDNEILGLENYFIYLFRDIEIFSIDGQLVKCPYHLNSIDIRKGKDYYKDYKFINKLDKSFLENLDVEYEVYKSMRLNKISQIKKAVKVCLLILASILLSLISLYLTPRFSTDFTFGVLAFRLIIFIAFWCFVESLFLISYMLKNI